jgi:diacylglycerol kinase (ATP)
MDKQKKRALVVYNPKSGSANKSRAQMAHIEQFLQEKLGYDVELLSCDCPRDEFTFAEHSLDGIDLLVAAGGDGTVSGVIEALAQAGYTIPIAIVPLGTGNLLARSLGIYPTKSANRTLAEEALDLYTSRAASDEVIDFALNVVAQGTAVPIDLAKANDKWMSIGAGVGPLASAISAPQSHHKKAWGMLAYMGSMLKLISRSHRQFLIKIEDEVPFETHALGVFISSLPNLGIGTPGDAHEMQDGLLDVFVVECTGPISFAAIWVKFVAWLIGGRSAPPYLSRRAKSVQVTALHHTVKPSIAKPRVAVDGDPAGIGPLVVEIVPRAATVLVPKWVARNPEVDEQVASSR